MSRDFFEQVSDQVAGFLPPSMRRFTLRRGSRNLKVWYGDEHREHFEVQIIRRGRGHALEIGFHAEHSAASLNDEVLSRVQKHARKLGPDVETGPFIGYQSKVWRRISEVWEGPELLTPATAIEAAERLAQYIRTLVPQGRPASR